MTINKVAILFKYLVLLFLAVGFLFYKIVSSENKFLNPSYYTFQGQTYYKPVDVKSSVVGNVDKINFQKGEKVKKGDLLVTLKNEEYLFTLDKYSQNKTIPFDVIDNLQKSIDSLKVFSDVEGNVVSENIKLEEKVFPSQRLITVADKNSYRYVLRMSYDDYNSQTIDFKSNLYIGSSVLISYYDGKEDMPAKIEDIEVTDISSPNYINIYIKPTKYTEFNPLEEVKIKFYKHTLFDNGLVLINKIKSL